MLLNFIDEVLASAPKYRITHADNTTEEVSIDLSTAVTTQGTALNKALFDKIDKYLCPVGIITMWSGSTSNIPTGWALCNGQNGTPDLRDRFIVGAGNTYTAGATGGSASVSLQEANLPSHNHTLLAYSGGSTGLSYTYLQANTGSAGGQVQITSGRCTRNSTSNLIGNTGSGTAHENRPPYYALAYIMKISN